MSNDEIDDARSFDYTVPHGQEMRAYRYGLISPTTTRHGPLADDLSVVAAQLVEAACRARSGDREATRAHIARAIALLRGKPRPGQRAILESSAHRLDKLRLRRVLNYIDANIGNDICLENLARVARYSLFHFARKFTVAMGISPHRYISEVRMKVAMAELVAGKLPLAEIAFNAHFSSQASFTRAFRRATGMTPLEYRRRGIKETAN
jgi:AraC-like DNA-binding protein